MDNKHKTLADLYKEQNGIVDGPSKTDEELIKQRLSKTQNADIIEDMSSKGIVIDTPKPDKGNGIKITGISSSSMDHIQETLKGMDSEILAAKEEMERAREEMKRVQEQKAKEESIPRTEQSADKAVILIDKFRMGDVNFTPEERAKLEKVSKIELQEIEAIPLETLKINKGSSYSIDKVLKEKKNTGSTSNIVAVASGYTAVMSKCSLFELANLFIDRENILETQLCKWSFIYSKIVSSSVKFDSFDDFIKQTAIVDYNNFIFGILAPSYPDQDNVTLTCTNRNCKGKTINGKSSGSKEYEYPYSVKGLIRTERMSDKLAERFTEIIDRSYSENDAEMVHKESPVMNVKRFKLPASGYIIDAGVETVYDFLYNASAAADALEDDKYRQSLMTATLIRKLYIPDEQGSYFEFEDKLDIAKAIYELTSGVDVKAIIKITSDLSEDLTFDYGFHDVKCPYCGHNTEYVPVDPDDILFHKYRQETTMIE